MFVPNATSAVNIAAWPLGLARRRRGAVDEPRVRRARPHVGARLRRLRRALRPRSRPTARFRRGRDRRRRLVARRAAYARPLPEPPHVVDGVDVAGGGAVPARARARASSPSSTAHTSRDTSRSTCARLTSTSTRATVTNGCAHPRAQASSTSGASFSRTSIRSCSAGATTPTSRRSSAGTRSRERGIRPRISPSRSRSSGSASTAGMTSAHAVTSWRVGPRPTSASNHWCQAREMTYMDRWCRSGSPRMRRRT